MMLQLAVRTDAGGSAGRTPAGAIRGHSSSEIDTLICFPGESLLYFPSQFPVDAFSTKVVWLACSLLKKQAGALGLGQTGQRSVSGKGCQTELCNSPDRAGYWVAVIICAGQRSGSQGNWDTGPVAEVKRGAPPADLIREGVWLPLAPPPSD